MMDVSATGFITLVSATGFILLSILMTFGTTNTIYEWAFRPQPANSYYDAMLVAILCSIPITDFIAIKLKMRSHLTLFNAFTGFRFLILLLLGIMNLVAGAPASGSIWLIFLGLLMFLFYRLGKPDNVNWSYQRKRSWGTWMYSLFLVLISIGFLAFPVAQRWDGPPEPFVRWHPFSVKGEIVWRGIFSTYVINFLWTAIEDPAGKHILFALYVGISGILHSTTMLVMNLVEYSLKKNNGNLEHLYGDIAGWYLIGLISLGFALSKRKSCSVNVEKEIVVI